MNIQFKLAASYLWGRKLRTLLTTLAVVLGVMIIFGLNGMIPTMVEAFRQNMMAAAGQVDLTVTNVANASFGMEALDIVRQTEGIARATGSLRRNVSLPPGAVTSSVMLVGLDPETAQDVRAYTVTEGRFLEVGDEDVMVIPNSLADKTGLGIGDTLTLPAATGSTDFEIVGVIASRALPGVEEVYVPLEAARRLLNQPGEINTIEALFAPGADRESVEADVQARLGDLYKIGALESSIELISTLEIGQIALNMFGVMALAMGGFVILNTFRTIVTERRHDIGMLRAVGASRGAILGAVIAESLLQGVFGTAVGMLLGYAFAAALMAVLTPLFESYLRFRLQGGPVITPAATIAAIVLGIGVTVLGGLFPAINASRLVPLEALRPTPGEVYRRVASRGAIVGAVLIVLAALGLVSGIFPVVALGTLLFLAGLVLIAPALVHPIATVFGRLLTAIFAREGQIAQGNLARQPGRAAITASALMIGLAILVALGGMITSIFNGFLSYLDRSLGSDFLLMPSSLILSMGNVGASPELAQEIGDLPEIEGVTTLRLGLAHVDGSALQLIGIDPVTYPRVSGLVFSAGEEQAYSRLAEGRTLISNGIFAAQHGLEVGDSLMLQTPEGNLEYRVVAIGLDYLNAKLATAYISQGNLERDFHQTSDLLIMANKRPDADADAVRARLEEIVVDYPAFALFSAAEWRESQKQIFTASLGMLYVMMIALAAPSLLGLVNTLAINVLERTREIGVIRAVGGTQQQIRRMILAESLLLSAMGAAFGILAGLWLGYVMVGALNFSGFVLEYSFPYAGILIAIAVGLLFGVIASVVPARQAAQMEIVAALRYE